MNPLDYFNEDYLRDYFFRNIVKKNGGGRDNLTPLTFYEIHKNDFEKISQKCLAGTYRFSYYNEKLVLRGSKKLPRIISIPTIRDRIVLGVLNDYLSSVFYDSVSHEIPNTLIRKVSNYLQEQTNKDIKFLRTDFHNFYGTLYIKLLMDKIKVRVSDEAILYLIYEAITTPTIVGSKPNFLKRKRWQGIPQGLAISNLLSSIYMQSFDNEFGNDKSNAGLYIRYVDDILFIDVKNDNLQNLMINEIKKRNLKLKLSVDKCKSGIIGHDPMDFIGYIFDENKIFIRKKNVTQFLNRIAALTSKCRYGIKEPLQRPLFIKEEADFIGFYCEEINRLLSGFKYGNRLYGWMPYFQSITDVSSLYGMDHVIKNNILKGLPEGLTSKLNSLVDTYYDIHRNGGKNLLKNFDNFNIDQKRNYLYRKGRIDKNKKYTDEQINICFDSYMQFYILNSEKNIGEIS